MNSIVFKAKLFGLFTSILLCAMAYFALEYLINYSKAREITKSILLYKEVKKQLRDTSVVQDESIEELNGVQAREIITKAKHVIETRIYREVFQSGDIVLYLYEDYYYYSFKINGRYYYFKNLNAADNYILYLMIVSSVLILVLFLIYAYIVKALAPLRSLHQRIRVLGLEKDETYDINFSKNTDEVEEVSKAFDEAVKRIEALEETRTLFWRNIMHELKTPLTQGKLMVHVLKAEDKDKNALLQVFDKMQSQLDELKQLEYLKADNIELSLQKNYIIDIVDNVIDILGMEDENIHYESTTQSFSLNFDLFSVALKNLIANALCYSSDKKVYIKHKRNHLYIINKGKPLKEDFDVYTQAFVRNEENKSGMGLGLYISKAILAKHNITLQHKYLNHHHLIILDLSKISR